LTPTPFIFIPEDVKRIAGSSDKSISVAIEEVAADEWVEKVYEPDIAANWNALYKKPGYKPSDL
jgi:4-oxalocrotonate tautomerase